jgi:hypothetical protein
LWPVAVSASMRAAACAAGRLLAAVHPHHWGQRPPLTYTYYQCDWHSSCAGSSTKSVPTPARAASPTVRPTMPSTALRTGSRQTPTHTVSAGRENVQQASGAVAVPVRAGAQPSACEVRRRCPRRGRERPADGCDHRRSVECRTQRQSPSRRCSASPNAGDGPACATQQPRRSSTRPLWWYSK